MNMSHQIKQAMIVTGFEGRRKILSYRLLFPMLCAAVIFAFAYANGSGEASGMNGSDAQYAFLRPFVASAPLVLAISAIVMSTDSLSEEFERRSGFITFTKPISRNTLFIGKFLSGFFPSMIVLAFYYTITFVACFIDAGNVPSRAFAAIPLATLYLLAITGICLLFSALSPKGSIAMIVSFFLLIVLQIFMQNMSFTTEPWYSIGYESGILENYVLGDVTEFHIDGSSGLYADEYRPDTALACSVMSVYAVFSTIVAAFVFRYRDIK